MNKKIFKWNWILCFGSLFLSGCLGSIWTGASLFYDRHHIFKKTTDIGLAAKIGHAIKMEPSLNCPSNRCFEIATFHGDVLLLGTVQNQEQKDKAKAVALAVQGYRHLYNYIQMEPQFNYEVNLNDHWITTKIRSQVLANSDIDPDPFKVVTYNQVVYLLGDVLDSQEDLIINIAKDTERVSKVVNLLQSYSLTRHPKKLVAD
jgi:osmotically-inducible protein OsmY